MRAAFAVIIIVCLLAAGCCAQSMSRSQYVGGNYGQNWISNFQAQNPKPAEQNLENDLWNWGGAPKGSIAVNGKLVPDPYYLWKSLNYTSGWLGKAYVDPSTGYPVYAYMEPYTGMIIYFYIDPNTGKPVYTNAYPVVGGPYYGGISPYYSPNYWPEGVVLSPVFNSNSPWG